MQINTFPAVLTESFMVSPNVRHFIFALTQSPAFNYTPGQFITIHFENNDKPLKRSYSIANVPLQNNCIEFAAGYVADGPGTKFLFGLKAGDNVVMSGPYGRLILREELPGRYILVATSTGVTPYRAMLAELSKRLQAHPNLQVVILLGVQTSADVLYRQEFIEFCQRFPQQVQFRMQLSRSSKAELKNNEYKGYVQHAFSELNLDPQQDMVYLCGNPGMIDDSFELLKAQGFAMQQIIREKYISR